MSCVFLVMGLVHSFTLSGSKTFGSRFWCSKISFVAIFFLQILLSLNCTRNISCSPMLFFFTYFYGWCVNPDDGMECLPHVARPCCVSEALLHLVLDRRCLRFLSLQLTQKISVSDCLMGLTVVLLLNPACVIHHLLSWAVRSSHDKCNFCLYGTAVLASHFQPPLTSRSLCAC